MKNIKPIVEHNFNHFMLYDSKLEDTKYVTKNMYYESSNKLINNGQPKTMYSKSKKSY